MTKSVFIKPAEGVLVRHPRTFVPIPAKGKNVSWNGYWKRLLDQGDIAVIQKEPQTASEE